MARWVKIWLQWPRVLQRSGFDPQPRAVDERIWHCSSCSLDLIPGLETSIYLRCGHKKKKKIQTYVMVEREKGSINSMQSSFIFNSYQLLASLVSSFTHFPNLRLFSSESWGQWWLRSLWSRVHFSRPLTNFSNAYLATSPWAPVLQLFQTKMEFPS